MNHPLQCRCGTLQGHLVLPGMARRGVCYCRDCQAFARVLGQPSDVLDANGGTPIVATLPRQVRFTQGTGSLACLSLSPKGLLRWHAGCCNTPIGNTPRDPRLPYVGLIGRFLQGPSAPSLDAAFGTDIAVLNAKSAQGPVASTPVHTLLATLGIMGSVMGARLRGHAWPNPFFAPGTDVPVARPRVLTRAERDAATPPASPR